MQPPDICCRPSVFMPLCTDCSDIAHAAKTGCCQEPPSMVLARPYWPQVTQHSRASFFHTQLFYIHLFRARSLIFVLLPQALSFTYNSFTRATLSHATLSHTTLSHTQLCHMPVPRTTCHLSRATFSRATLSHTTLLHSFTYNIITLNFLTHNSFTHNCFTDNFLKQRILHYILWVYPVL